MSSRNCLILHQNYNDLGSYISRAVSSASATHPFANILDESDRSRTWRSAGYWEVKSPHNVLVFQEVDGVDLTATVAVGTYTTLAAFLSAVAAAMVAGGTKLYTATQDSSSKRLKLTTSNGTFLKLRTTAAASAGLAQALGFSIAYDRTGALTYTADVVKCHTKEFIQFDFGMSVNPSAIVLAGAARVAHGVSALGQVRVLGNDTPDFTNPAYQSDVTFDQAILAVVGRDGLHSRGLRYWRIEIIDPMNPKGYIELNKVYIGEAYAPKVGAVQFPLKVVSRDRSTTMKAKSGRKYSIRRTPYEDLGLDWSGLTNSEHEDLQRLFEIFLQSKPFFIALDSKGVFTANPSKSIRWVTFAEEPSFDMTEPNFWTSGWRLEEML